MSHNPRLTKGGSGVTSREFAKNMPLDAIGPVTWAPPLMPASPGSARFRCGASHPEVVGLVRCRRYGSSISTQQLCGLSISTQPYGDIACRYQPSHLEIWLVHIDLTVRISGATTIHRSGAVFPAGGRGAAHIDPGHRTLTQSAVQLCHDLGRQQAQGGSPGA